MSQHNTITIVEPDLIVSQDMCDALHAAIPQVRCTVFRTVEEARAAFLDAAPDLVVVSADLNGRIKATDQDVRWLIDLRVIAIDPRLPQAPEGWAQLEKPFTEDQLIKAAKKLLFNPYDSSRHTPGV